MGGYAWKKPAGIVMVREQKGGEGFMKAGSIQSAFGLAEGCSSEPRIIAALHLAAANRTDGTDLPDGYRFGPIFLYSDLRIVLTVH